MVNELSTNKSEKRQITVDIFRNVKGKSSILLVLLAVLISAILFSFTIGRYSVTLNQLFEIIRYKTFGGAVSWPESVSTVLFKIRIPRVFIAVIIGAALAIAGVAYQGLFKNPMVSPDILGASSGAGYGAAIAILLSFGSSGIQISAFLFGLAAVLITIIISKCVARSNNNILALVLTGMVVNTLFSSFISITKYLADTDDKLPAITFWLMGGLSSVSLKDLLIMIFPFLVGIIPLLLIRWKLNVLSFGEEEAQGMGVDTRKIRALTIFCSTLLTASAVSIGGMIGWIGLIIPHIARLIVGPNYKVLLPASALIGGIFLLIVDDVARCLLSIEIPIGILTSIIGAPFFLYLLFKERRQKE
ncbi:iron ABC transporter permease [Clostridium chromiireducens]|uniref:Iron ABC transporter permease n=1 Tax=Clostridium chromiireducens TaxID=225345 RepID=A0A399IP72_9CLOT|nr:iron ABC transporter permease [Clostridium chromiireducens]RII34387.1 iron ABC transporter permease [Clostridium chromiireducens]